MWSPRHRGSGQGYREIGDGPLSPQCHLSKCHLFQAPSLAFHCTQTTRGTGDPNTNSSLFAVVFVCWHLNGSLWFRFEASLRQKEIGRGWRGATLPSTLLPPSLTPQPSPFIMYYHCSPGNFLPRGPILCCFTSAYLRNKSLLKGEILMKCSCVNNRNLLETQCPDSDERKMVGNFRHRDRSVRADQATPQGTLPTLFVVDTTDTGVHWPSSL